MIGNWKASNSIISRRTDNRDVGDESFFTTSYFPCTIKVYIFLSSLICIPNTSPVTTVTLSVELQIAYLFYHYVIFFSRKDVSFIKTHFFVKKHKLNEMNFGKCTFLSVINTIWKMWNKFININCILTHTIYVLSHKSEI